jgi:hypothetical protein
VFENDYNTIIYKQYNMNKNVWQYILK